MKKYKNCYNIGPFEQFTRKVCTTNDGLTSNQATALCFDKKGVLYVGTKSGLSKLSGDAFTEVDLGIQAEITMLYCAENGRIYVGADEFLFELDGKKKISCEKFGSKIVDMKIDGDGAQWILTKDILFKRAAGSKKNEIEIGVPGDGTKLAVLKNNKVYAGTNGGGLHALAGKRWHWSELTQDVTGLISNTVTCVEFDSAGNIWVGTDKGVCVYDDKSCWLDCFSTYGLPDADITGMAFSENGDKYFSTTTGLIHLHNGKLSYYGYKRWLPSPEATDVAVSSDGTKICVATKEGISIIEKNTMTLEEKAAFFRETAEKYNVRKDGYSLGRTLENCGVVDENEGYVGTSDNDGLWTGLYLVGLCYEYAVTKNEKILEMARRSLKAMIKLTTITGKEGFTARAVRYSDEPHFGEYKTNPEWRLVPDGTLEWLGETSSDEMTGHFLAYSTFYDLCANEEEKAEIREVVTKIMNHIIENDFRLVDIDGKPTTWANWNPNDLNNDHKWIYEKGTNSLEILAFLKVAEHMTGDDKYAKIFDDFANKYHYGMNIMQYKIPDGHLLHIDDQLDFINILTFMRNTDDPSIRSLAAMGLTHHWNDERVERNAWFNVIYGAITNENCDIDVIADELVDFPLDMLSWEVYNSHRTDLRWNHAPEELGMCPQLFSPLEAHERRICNSDCNRFVCDCGCEELLNAHEDDKPSARPMFPGVSCSKGFTLEVANNFFLPYWMARYYGMIK